MSLYNAVFFIVGYGFIAWVTVDMIRELREEE